MSYDKDRRVHLELFAKEHGLAHLVGGDHNGDGIPRGHILLVNKIFDPKKKGGPGYVIDREDQFRKIVKYNLLEGINPDMYKKEKVHDKANHLNSSQVLCYNFFRPLMDDEAHPDETLIALLAQHGIQVTGDAVCEFEFNPPYYGLDGRQESSEIDFHVQDPSNDTEVFFEIKYTEAGFGKWTGPKESNFRNFYEPMISECVGLYSEQIAFDDEFIADYQLYRNALRVSKPSTYTVFLFPKGSPNLVAQYNSFESKIKMKNNIQAWFWEDIVTAESFPRVFEKYFA